MTKTNMTYKRLRKIFIIFLSLTLITTFGFIPTKVLANEVNSVDNNSEIEEYIEGYSNIENDSNLYPVQNKKKEASFSPFKNPIQEISSSLYKKVFGNFYDGIADNIIDIVDRVLGIEDNQESEDKKIEELSQKIGNIQKQMDELKNQLGGSTDKIIDKICELKTDLDSKEIKSAIVSARQQLDPEQGSAYCVMLEALKNYQIAKKANNKQEMQKELQLIADIDFEKYHSNYKIFEECYLKLQALTMPTAGTKDDSGLTLYYNSLLKSNSDLVFDYNEFCTAYTSIVSSIEKITQIQLISVTAKKELMSLQSEMGFSDKAYNTDLIKLRYKQLTNRLKSTLKNLDTLKTRTNNVPSLGLSIDNGLTYTYYHSLSDAWVDAQREGVNNAIITLSADYVYSGEQENFYQERLDPTMQNMCNDLCAHIGQLSSGYFKCGNLNVTSGKNITLNLNGHTLANLRCDQATLNVSSGASLNITGQIIDGRTGMRAGQINNVLYENNTNSSTIDGLFLAETFNYNKIAKDVAGKYVLNKLNNVGAITRNCSEIMNQGCSSLSVNNCYFNKLNGLAHANGGVAIYMGHTTNTTNINNCTFNQCRSYYGGAICSDGGHMKISGSTFYNCYALRGGAIYSKSPKIEEATDQPYEVIDNCVFDQNYCKYSGGAILTTTQLDISKTQFTNNLASKGNGGAVSVKNEFEICEARVKLNECRAENNQTRGGNGGAIHGFGTIISINDSVLNNNNALVGDGGAVCSQANIEPIDGRVSVYNSSLQNNHAGHDGGAVYAKCGGGIENSSITNNTIEASSPAQASGAGVFFDGDLHLRGVVEIDNNYGIGGYRTNMRFHSRDEVDDEKSGIDVVYLNLASKVSVHLQGNDKRLSCDIFDNIDDTKNFFEQLIANKVVSLDDGRELKVVQTHRFKDLFQAAVHIEVA